MADERFEQHLRRPLRRGTALEGARSGVAGGAACGDLVRIDVRVEGGTVVEAGFDADGCGATIAAGSAAVALVDGRALLEAALVGTDRIAAELGGLSPGKIHAAELAADALHRALGEAARHDAEIESEPDRVLVAMSGGVDSAVAALLTQRSGADVVAVTLELWRDAENDGERSCCSASAVRGARALAHQLGLPHLTLDLRDEFRAGVVEPWLADTAAGLTPNPCVRCNGQVRLDAMLALADRLGAAAMATGHYARVTADGLLRAAEDPRKDQSYMLAALAPASIARMRFPLGELTKPEVRAIAERAGMPVAAKPDSQDLCFLAGTGRDAFLARHGGVRDRPGRSDRPRRSPRRPPSRPPRLHRRPTSRCRRRRHGRAALRACDRRGRQHGHRRAARGAGDARSRAARHAPAPCRRSTSTASGCDRTRRSCRARSTATRHGWMSRSRGAAPGQAAVLLCDDVVVGVATIGRR